MGTLKVLHTRSMDVCRRQELAFALRLSEACKILTLEELFEKK
jgi:hypothetical protein